MGSDRSDPSPGRTAPRRPTATGQRSAVSGDFHKGDSAVGLGSAVGSQKETVRKVGVPFAPGYNLPFQENGRDRVQWRVIVELSSTVGAKQVHEVHVGGNATPECSAATLGLSLAEAKSVLAGLQAIA
jgi:hypothetical protein